MSIYPVLCDYVALPNSQIRGPGSILKNVNSSNLPTSRQHQIKKYLDGFKEMITTSDPEEGISESHGLRPRASTYLFPEITINDTLVDGPQMKQLINHLRTKSSNDEVECLIKKAVQILGFYQIELIVEVREKYYDELYKMLSYLVPEVCLFPEGFIRKLGIRHLVICDSKALSFFKKKYSEKDTSLFIITHEEVTDTQVHKELYKTIFQHMIKTNKKLAEEWGQSTQTVESEGSGLSTEEDLETAYMYLMQNSNHVLFKDKKEKMAKILTKHFPDELTEDWFKAHNKERKKSCRVKIGSSVIVSIETYRG